VDRYIFSTEYVLLIRDSFWSYELCKRFMNSDDDDAYQSAMNILLCGGVAGVVTWGSVFPLDMIKTRLQAQTIGDHGQVTETQALLGRRTLSSFQIAKETYRAEGVKAFYRGLGVCSIRAFIVNAVQVCSLPL
jgi:solute carrier family 25 carnitine/acylcarnitine transporter 20/29